MNQFRSLIEKEQKALRQLQRVQRIIEAAVDQQHPPAPSSGPVIHDLVVDDLEKLENSNYAIMAIQARAIFGAQKYKEPLRIDNGRDPQTELLQEIADAAAYSKQLSLATGLERHVSIYWKILELLLDITQDVGVD